MSKLSANSASHLRKYLNAAADIQDLYEFLIGAEYDPEVSSSERDTLADVRAVAIEVAEGRRLKADLDLVIRSLLKKPAPTRTR